MDNRQHNNDYPQRPFSSKNAPDKFLQNYAEDEDDIDDLNYDELIDNFDETNQMGIPNFSSFPNRPTKKRKFNNLQNYRFAPRLSRNNNNINNNNNNNNSCGNSYSNDSNVWSEQETFSLLEAWGNKYLGGRRKSLRIEDWNEVAERVSEGSEIERTDSECRNRLDTLKKKYKKERARIEEGGGGGGGSNWIYFKRMDMLLGDRSKGEYGLACGVDSGEYVFMNPSVYLNCSNGFDEMRDSPAEEEDDDEEDESEEEEEQDEERSESYRMLVDSVHRFGQIYEKIEKSKRKQMVELEKMRMDFQRDMELQKKQMMDKVQAEIEKIGDNADDGGGDDKDDTDGSAENLSG